MSSTMNFGDAVRALKDGKRVARAGWNGRGMWLTLVKSWNGAFGGPLPPEMQWSMGPFICMKTVGDVFVPWLASQTDVLADDWGEVEMPEVTPLVYAPLTHSSDERALRAST